MVWSRIELKSRAKDLLQRDYWKNVLAGVIVMIASGTAYSAVSSRITSLSRRRIGFGLYGINFMMLLASLGIILVSFLIGLSISIVLSYFIWGPLEAGAKRYFLDQSEYSAEITDIFLMVTNQSRSLRISMLIRRVICVAGSMLLIVPGVIKHYESKMVPYLLIAYPDMKVEEVFKVSKRMMEGNKWEAFILDLSFFGWHVLGIATLGIVEVFFVSPYVHLTEAELYRVLRNTV